MEKGRDTRGDGNATGDVGGEREAAGGRGGRSLWREVGGRRGGVGGGEETGESGCEDRDREGGGDGGG